MSQEKRVHPNDDHMLESKSRISWVLLQSSVLNSPNDVISIETC